MTDEFCTDESFIWKQDPEYEIWVVRYTDSSQASTAVDAIIYIEETLKPILMQTTLKKKTKFTKLSMLKTQKSQYLYI